MAVGGKRTGAGRPAGIPNKVTAEIRELARQYAPAALQELVRLSTRAESEQVRVAACREILDRGFGKSTLAIAADTEFAPIRLVIEGAGPNRVAAFKAIEGERCVAKSRPNSSPAVHPSAAALPPH